jgi:hypothetical protein
MTKEYANTNDPIGRGTTRAIASGIIPGRDLELGASLELGTWDWEL